MAQTMMHGDPKLLPLEMITNILKRLPVKSLLRFQCVCTQWKNLIRNPSFIADHLHHSTHHNPPLLFQRSFSSKDLSVDLCMLDCKKQHHEILNVPFDSSVSVGIVGSCNGLLCVEGSSCRFHSLLLWNLAIRKIKQVHSHDCDFDGNIYVGYGFSPIVNDYKILKVYVLEDEMEVIRVEVYSLSTQRWKEIEFGNLKGVNFGSEAVTANGVMFWLGSKLGNEQDFVVSFDIAVETFSLIPMLVLDKNHKYSGHKLTVYENKLGVISYFIEPESFTTDSWLIDLWVMEDGIGAPPQERWVWTEKYSVITFTGSEHPLGIVRIDPLCIWGGELVCNCIEMSGIAGETEYEENIEVNEMLGWEENINGMFGISGVTESEEKMLNVLCLLNLRTNELRKIATGRSYNTFSVILNHAESLVPIDKLHIQEVHQT